MKLRSNYLFVIFPLLLIGFAITNKKFSDPNKDRLLMEVVKYVVEKGHYKKFPLMIIYPKIYIIRLLSNWIIKKILFKVRY